MFFNLARCERCGYMQIAARCYRCQPVEPATVQPTTMQVDPNNWSTIWHAKQNAARLAEDDCEAQEAWRRSRSNSTSNSR